MHDAPSPAATAAGHAPRDRRMDIAALCEPTRRDDEHDEHDDHDDHDGDDDDDGDDVGGAVGPHVPAALQRVQQDRILDCRHHHHHNHHHVLHAFHRRPPSIADHRGDSPIAVLSAVALAGSHISSASTRSPPSVPLPPSSRPLAPLPQPSLPLPSQPSPSQSAQPASELRVVAKPPVAPSKKRARRMTNSERGKLYRSRRKTYVEALEGEVQELQQELQGLQLYGSLLHEIALHAPHATGGAFSRVVGEYFALFAAGIPLDPGERTELTLVRPTPRQAAFMDTLLDAEMEFCGGGGPRRLMRNWKAFSLYHSSLRYSLEQLHVVLQAPAAVVTADAVLRVRLTRAAVEHMFPHVLWNAALVQRLVGREVAYHVRNVFYFGESGRVVRYESHVDFLGAFMAALGSLADAVELAGPISERQQREQFGDAHERRLSSSSSASSSVDEDPDATE